MDVHVRGMSVRLEKRKDRREVSNANTEQTYVGDRPAVWLLRKQERSYTLMFEETMRKV